MKYTLLDGTQVEYRVLTPVDAGAAVRRTTDDATMFVELIRLAVVRPDNVLERLAGLPDRLEQTALLGRAIILATLQAHLKSWSSSR